MIELAPTPASVVAATLTGSPRGLAERRRAAFSAQRHNIDAAQKGVVGQFGQSLTRATKLFSVSAVYDGVAVRTDASRLAALSRLPGVKAIHRLEPKKIDNTVTVPLTKAVQLWRDAGNDIGTGVTIGVIDTGIDYTHADFGGPGDKATYTTAEANDTATPSAATYDANKFATQYAGQDGGILPVAASEVGVDLAGDNYDPSAGLPGDPDTNLNDEIPAPDNNPLDCNGHGTHVAGSAAGLGVTTSGATYTGSYTDTGSSISTFENQFSVGPGMAPGAKLLAIKIFGCGETGTSSDLITQALDWAAAPNGDPNSHLDVVNLSLGSDFSPPDDPDAVAANNASLAGVTVVAASGNAGDLFNAGGAPGNATRAIGVAASDDSQDVTDGLQVDTPAGAQNPATSNGAWPAEESVAYHWAQRPAVQGSLAEIGGAAFDSPSSSNDSDGCDPLSPADAGAVAGKIAFLYWADDDATRRCGSAVRTDNLADAGAIGVVFASDVDVFTAAITGDSAIPAMLTTKSARDAILPLVGGGVTVTLTHALHNQLVLTHPSTVDNVASFSSRGISAPGVVKPDVTAPGVTVFSAASGTGSEGVSFSGTSMATPHVAGEAALVLAAHPAWLTDAHNGDNGSNKANVPLEVKAAIMNTASNPVTCASPAATPTCSGMPESPNRVGSGRIDAEAAAAAQVVAYAADPDDVGGVSVSFGRVDVAAAPVTKTRVVHVVNTGSSAVPAYTASYATSNDMPGVTISAAPTTPADQAMVTIPALGMQSFTVTMTADPTTIADRPDPTLDAFPSALGGQFERSFVADESGRLVFTPQSGSAGNLVVPAYAAPRHVSTMHAPSTVSLNTSGFGSLPLTGSEVFDQGSGATSTVASSVDSFELQGVSGVLPFCHTGAVPPGCVQSSADRAANLKAVGVTSDIPVYTELGADPYGGSSPALAYIGIATQQPWRTPSDLNEYDVMIDANGDGLPDAVLFNTRVDGTDVFVSQLDALLQGRGGFVDGPTLDEELLNGIDPSATDTSVFDSDVMTLPFAVAALEPVGFDPTHSTRISYWVQGVSGESGIVDTIGDPQRGQQPMSVDLARPALYASDTDSGLEFPSECSGLSFCFSTLNADTAGVNLKVVDTKSSVAADKPLGLLLLHHNNATGSRAQVVRFASSISATLAKPTAPYGYRNPLTVHLSSTVGIPSGTVTVAEGATKLATGTLRSGGVVLTLPVRSVGKHTLTVSYSGDVAHGTSSRTVTLTVTRASTRTTLSMSGTTSATLTATTRVVAPGAGLVSGSIRFYDNGHLFATLRTSGTVHVHRTLTHGRHTLTASYLGGSVLAPSSASRVVSV